MAKIKSHSLLARVSTLMIIHVVFIFAALALVLLFGGDRCMLTQHFRAMDDRLNQVSNEIFAAVNTAGIADRADPRVEALLGATLKKYEYIAGLELVPLNRALKALPEMPSYGSSPVSDGDETRPDSLSRGSNKILAGLSDDRNYITYFISPSAADAPFALSITASNVLLSSGTTDLIYALILLFLVSTLISLLLVNLIYKNVRKPLKELIAAFRKMAHGEEYTIDAKYGEKDMAYLCGAFNDMSASLADNRARLENTNRQLRQTNKTLQESEAIMTSLIDYSPDAIIVTDMNDRVTIYNLTAAQDFGYDQNDMLGIDVGSLIKMPGDDAVESVEGESSQSQEVICRQRRGRNFPALMVQTQLVLGGDKPTSKLYFLKNISESKNYQEMVLKLDRIASRGKMARDIAHEINNYLAILQGNLELLPMLLEKGDQDKVMHKVELMRGTVDNITKFTKGLSRFSDENSNFNKEDLNQLIENLIAFVKPQNRFDNIEFETILADNIPLVEIDVGQVQLLLVNLLYNAAEAMESNTTGRKVMIKSGYDETNRNFTISVCDNGGGVEAENRERLFVSRFSTKRGGNGLGLITAKNIVDNHRGQITYTPAEQGSVFTAVIPVHHTAGVDAEASGKTAAALP